MTRALLDTTVLYAAANERAGRHETALAIVRGADDGTLPELDVPDPILVETMNGLTRDVGPATATDVQERTRRAQRFDVRREPDAVWQTGLSAFEEVDRLSLADAVLLASARHRDVEYCYSFDGLDGITRLDTPANPFSPD